MEGVPTEDLQDRLTSVVNDLDIVLKELGKQLTRAGELRKEAAVIEKELKRRGAPLENAIQPAEVQKP